MKSPSLDNIYIILDKHILLAQAYSEIEDLSFIIKSCRLKPHSYVFEKIGSDKIVLYRHWIDEFGNSLHITKQKKVKIVYNDLLLDRHRIICSDLYYGLSLNKIAKISKFAYFLIGKDEDLYQDCHTLVFLGIDNYFRAYQYIYGEWKQISPLLLGMKTLKIIAQNTDLRFFKNLTNKENAGVPCIHSEQWLTSLPASNEFMSIIKKRYEFIYAILDNKKEI